MVSKEVFIGDLAGDFGGDRALIGRCFCSLLVGDLVGLLGPLLALPLLTSTLSCGGGIPLAPPARSNRFAILLTDPAGRVAKLGVDLALFKVCVGGSRRTAGALRTGDCDTALGASETGGCSRCGGLPRVGGGVVANMKSSPLCRVALKMGGASASPAKDAH